MTHPVIARVTRALPGLLALAAIGGCTTNQPRPQRFTASSRAPLTIVMPSSPRFAPPYSLVIPGPPEGDQPRLLVPGTPQGDGLCKPGSLRCGEIHPTPGSLCLLSTERCPRDGKFERIDSAASIPSR